MSNIWQVETIAADGTVIHGFSINAYDADTARAVYMAHPERPHLNETDRVIVR